jgi:hypothetical protein
MLVGSTFRTLSKSLIASSYRSIINKLIPRPRRDMTEYLIGTCYCLMPSEFNITRLNLLRVHLVGLVAIDSQLSNFEGL